MAKVELPPNDTLFPVPVCLVSCINKKKNKPNIITIAWCGTVCSRPPLISVSIRPGRYSYGLIRDAGDFVINIPQKDILVQVDQCGIRSGCDTDKFAMCSFTAEPSSKISSPRIRECHVNIECRLLDTRRLGTHDMFIGEAVAVHVDASIMDTHGRIDFKKASPIVYNLGAYWDLGEEIGHHGFSI